MKSLILAFILAVVVAGCVGSPLHSTLKYHSVQYKIEQNNDALISLKAGMTKDEVLKIIGKPESSEGYAWGFAWFYRTMMTSGTYGTSDSDFTPVIFDESEKLVGWGRNFFTQKAKKYEIEVQNK